MPMIFSELSVPSTILACSWHLLDIIPKTLKAMDLDEGTVSSSPFRCRQLRTLGVSEK
jgi:hypothetical protein